MKCFGESMCVFFICVCSKLFKYLLNRWKSCLDFVQRELHQFKENEMKTKKKKYAIYLDETISIKRRIRSRFLYSSMNASKSVLGITKYYFIRPAEEIFTSVAPLLLLLSVV